MFNYYLRLAGISIFRPLRVDSAYINLLSVGTADV